MELFDNKREHLGAFVRLNEAWITRHFAIEEADRALAAAPERIIDEGGYVFSLVESGEVVGVCALFNLGEGGYELARMAVAPASQGNGYGDILMRAALSKLDALGARKVVLLSNTALAAAIALYKKHGFVAVSEGTHPVYNRCDIIMEKWLHALDEGVEDSEA